MVETVVPTGERGIAKVALRDIVAASSAFQTAVGAADAAEAKAYLHITDYSASSFKRPCGIIMATDNDSDERIANLDFRRNGDLELRFEAEIADEYADSPDDAELTFDNFWENVVAEIEALAGTAGYLHINNITKIEGPTQFEKEDDANTYFYMIRLLVGWGLQ